MSQAHDILLNFNPLVVVNGYSVHGLLTCGFRQFFIGGVLVKRIDFELINKRNQAIQCSHFEPVDNYCHPKPCVIYLHGNGGGRYE